MKPFYNFKLLLFSVFAIIQACQSTGPVQFGNRKFYPDPVKKFVNAPSNKEIVEPSNNLRPSINNQGENITDENNEIRTADSQILQNEITTPIHKVQEKVAGEKTKLSFRERIAFSILKHTALGKGNKVSLINDDKKTPGGAIAGFILGLLGIFVAGLILGTLGIIFSAIALSKDSSEYKKGLAIAGLILGLIAVIGALVVIATVV